MKTLAIIPARKGSKGIPHKNMVDLCGKPLIQWTLESVPYVNADHIAITTDDEGVRNIAVAFGCKTEWEHQKTHYPQDGYSVHGRPPELAADDTPMVAVLKDVLLSLADEKFDAVVLLQPTCPLRSPSDVNGALALLEGDCDSVVSMTECSDDHPARTAIETQSGFLMWREMHGGYSTKADPDFRNRQGLERVLHRAGSVYACKASLLLESPPRLVGRRCRPFIVPKERAVNIDDYTDLALATALLKNRAAHEKACEIVQGTHGPYVFYDPGSKDGDIAGRMELIRRTKEELLACGDWDAGQKPPGCVMVGCPTTWPTGPKPPPMADAIRKTLQDADAPTGESG